LNSGATPISQKSLDALILKALVAGEMHSLGITRRIRQIAAGRFDVQAGSLFAVLHRMEEQGWICTRWAQSENNRDAKYYRLAKAGQKQLVAGIKRWRCTPWDQGTPDHFSGMADIPADQWALILSAPVTALILLFSCPCSGQTVSLLRDGPREVPFQLFSGFLVVAEGDIDSVHHLKFVIDTGATRTCLDRSLVQELGLTLLQPKTIFQFDKKLRVDSAVVRTISVGPLRAETIVVNVADLSHIEASGTPFDAVIGLDLLQVFPFQIDYEHSRIHFGPSAPLAETMPMEPNQQVALITLEFHKRSTRFVLDTGARNIILFWERVETRRIDWKFGPTETWWSSIGGSVTVRGVYVRDISFWHDSHEAKVYLIHTPPHHALPNVDGYLAPMALGVRQISFDFDHHSITWSR
jgi:PadR family transcriptional regulator PadR